MLGRALITLQKQFPYVCLGQVSKALINWIPGTKPLGQVPPGPSI